MIDLSHLPEAPGRVEFFGPTGVGTNAWRAWVKPRGYSMLALYAFAPGNGGGGGRGNTAGAAKGGGGGGGSGGVSRLIVPLFLLPDVLYYRVSPGGNGGAGGASGNGTAGGTVLAPQSTLVSVQPASTTQYLLLAATAPATGGVGGLTTGSAAGGPAGAITAITACPLAALGTFLSIAGVAGTTAGLATGNNAGAAFTFTTGSQVAPGTGGGSSSTGGGIGGGYTTDGSPYLTTVGPASGFQHNLGGPQPRWYGGTGAAGSGSVGSLHGQPGAVVGTGGGGGGGCLTTGGDGGSGGPGLVVFHVW